MRTILTPAVIAAALLMFLPTEGHAANFAALAQPTTLATLIMLVAAGFCGFVAFQLWTIVRGGQMSSAWQLFVLAFALLAIVQLLNLLNALEIAAIPGWVIFAFSAVMVGAFILALTKSRQTLG